jgi:hypothetical protein
MLEKIVKYVPQGLKANKVCLRLYQAFVYCINFSPKECLYYKYNSHKLKKFKNIHKGQRCFIIGTGPSLNKTNLSLIKDEIIFGANTLYRGLEKFGITCDYYAISDEVVWKKHFDGILGLDTTLFIGDTAGKDYLSNIRFYKKYQKNKPIVIRGLEDIRSEGWLSKDLTKGAYWGSTIIIDICLQAAYYMGFKEVYLLGCDCDYSSSHRFDGLPTENVVQENWPYVFSAYQIGKEVYENDDREIINATVGGKLEVFKRKELEEVLKDVVES